MEMHSVPLSYSQVSSFPLPAVTDARIFLGTHGNSLDTCARIAGDLPDRPASKHLSRLLSETHLRPLAVAQEMHRLVDRFLSAVGNPELADASASIPNDIDAAFLWHAGKLSSLAACFEQLMTAPPAHK